MQHLYIDESGSMTSEHTNHWPYFVIALVMAQNKEKAKRVVKRFVSKKMEALEISDSAYHKMFIDGKFCELKGTCMSRQLQADFIEYICQNDMVKVFFVKIENQSIRYGLYNNTARAFNYVLGQALVHFFKSGLLCKDEYMLHIDNRNQKNGTTYSLEDYLNIQLCIDNEFANDIVVKYYDSAQNSLVQVADVFSNAYYKHCMESGGAEFISSVLNAKSREGYVSAVYQFPQRIIKITGIS